MAAGSPPDPGRPYAEKLAKKKAVTWATSLVVTASRWIRLPRPMAEVDFKLESFKSLASFVPATFKRKTKSGQDKFYYAAELSFLVNHENYAEDIDAKVI